MTEPRFAPVVSMDQLPALREYYRAGGRAIVSTNGCFDLLHAGHVRMLAEARALGDVLVVGINDDASVRQLKGPSRPLVAQQDRATLLAALKSVDHVVIFGGLLPCDMLERLRPDIHCKAADYTPDSLPEAEVVRRHGGRVHILPLKSGYATSEILNQLVKATGTAPDADAPPGDKSSQVGDTYSQVLSAMLAAGNVCRQAAYSVGRQVAAAADILQSAATSGRKVWIWQDPNYPTPAALAADVELPPGANAICYGGQGGAEKSLKSIAHGDVLLVITALASSQASAAIAQARAAGAVTIAMTLDSPIADCDTAILIGESDPLKAEMIQLAILSVLFQ